jgi:hypothetical protein
MATSTSTGGDAVVASLVEADDASADAIRVMSMAHRKQEQGIITTDEALKIARTVAHGFLVTMSDTTENDSSSGSPATHGKGNDDQQSTSNESEGGGEHGGSDAKVPMVDPGGAVVNADRGASVGVGEDTQASGTIAAGATSTAATSERVSDGLADALADAFADLDDDDDGDGKKDDGEGGAATGGHQTAGDVASEATASTAPTEQQAASDTVGSVEKSEDAVVADASNATDTSQTGQQTIDGTAVNVNHTDEQMDATQPQAGEVTSAVPPEHSSPAEVGIVEHGTSVDPVKGEATTSTAQAESSIAGSNTSDQVDDELPTTHLAATTASSSSSSSSTEAPTGSADEAVQVQQARVRSRIHTSFKVSVDLTFAPPSPPPHTHTQSCAQPTDTRTHSCIPHS